MFSTKAEVPQKSALQIKQDDKFFSRLLSKENSISYPSFRVAVTVPFVWESQPGTPKYTFCENTLPPLTPPPSYYSNTFNKKPLNKNKSNLFMALFPKLNLKKTIISSPSSFSSSLEKSGRRHFLSHGDGDDEEDSVTSPTSTLCFGITLSSTSKRTIKSV